MLQKACDQNQLDAGGSTADQEKNVPSSNGHVTPSNESFYGKIVRILAKFRELIEIYRLIIKIALFTIFFTLYLVFLGFALAHNYRKAFPLLVATLCLVAGFIYFRLVKPRLGEPFEKSVWLPLLDKCQSLWEQRFFRWALYISSIIGFLIYLILDTAENRYRLVSLCGLIFYLSISFIFSAHPSKVVWRPVIWGVVLQFLIGLLVLRWPPGFMVLNAVAEKTVFFLNYAQNGTRFVYGFLADPPNICGMHPVFAFTVIQTLLYFGSVISLLYYFGVMQFILRQLAWLMQFTMGTTAAESLNAAGCIFLGMTEAPLMIKPYFIKMTKSELHTVFASGFACIAGSLFVAYISFGACPVYLLSACVMSAPASISISKLLLPETEESCLKNTSDLLLPECEERSALEAISRGASSVIDVMAQILANLVVFIAFLSFVDNAFWWCGDLIGWDVTFEKFLGYLFFPLAFIMGSSDNPNWDGRMNEIFLVAQLMGTKTALNEFIAYQQMGLYTAAGQLTGRSQMIATFALCGFANFASLGIQLGTIGALCPEKRSDASEVIFRALVSGAISCFTTACVAGLVVSDPIKCEPIFMGGANCTKIL